MSAECVTQHFFALEDVHCFKITQMTLLGFNLTLHAGTV